MNQCSMEKLTAQEIIKKLQDAGITVEDFAFGEVTGVISDYPEAVEAQKVRGEFRATHNSKGKWDTTENWETYYKLPNEYKIAKTKFRQGLGLDWEEVHQQGGEGEGDHWESVKYFKDHDVYLKVVGFYASYDGTNFYHGWSSVSEVKPQQKTITVYE